MHDVLIVSFWNPTPDEPIKGIFIREQVHALCQQRSGIIFVEINILPSRGKVFETEIVEMDLYTNKVITLNIYSNFWKFIYFLPDMVYLQVVKHLKRRYANFKPSIVHSNVVFPCALVGIRLARFYKAKHVLTEHWSKVDFILRHPLYGKRALSAYHNSDAIICVSKYLASLVKLKTGNPNVFIVPNIIDGAVFKNRGFKVSGDNTLRMMCIATWQVPKRLDLILESLKSFATTTTRQISLQVVGKGASVSKYATMVYPDNLKVIFRGYESKENIALLFVETDIFMLASDQETFSIVTAEALSTGTPVLVSNVAALPELVDDENGLLVDNDLPAWVDALKRASVMTFDHDRIAANVAQKYTPKSIAAMIEDVYATVYEK